MNHSWLSSFIEFLAPESKLNVTLWADSYKIHDRTRFKKFVGIFTLFCAAAYILHFHFVDIPQHKEPIEKWFFYRYGVALFCVGIFLLYRFLPLTRYLRTPYSLACLGLCYLQGQTLIWHAGTPYQYGFIMAFIMAWTIQKNILTSAIFFLSLVLVQVDPLLMTAVPTPHIISHTILFLVALIFTRYGLKVEIEKFLSDMELLSSQKKNIEMSLEFSNQLLAFLPKLIGARMKSLISSRAVGVTEASDFVLRPRIVPVACLYSDVRGYTKKSRNLEFISNSLLTEVQNITEVVDECSGIPRKIGDLVFAYFDSGDLVQNSLKSSIAAIKIANINALHNESVQAESVVSRKIIITSGLSVVGNLGTSSSSIEITAMGPPINLAARIDELTKTSEFQAACPPDHIICPTELAFIIKGLAPSAKIYEVKLEELGLKIRDFEHEQSIWLIAPSLDNLEHLQTALHNYSQDLKERNGLVSQEAA